MARPDDDDFEERPRSRGERRARRREDDDEEDDRPRRRRSKGGALSGVIPYRNVMALTAYYCSFGSLIAILGTLTLVKALSGQGIPLWIIVLGLGLGSLLAPVAVVLGILGLNYVAKYPEARGTAHAITGIILGGLEIAGILIIMFAKLIPR